MSETKNVLEVWGEVKALVEIAEIDVLKNANGNFAAGIRARRALRLLRNKTTELIKTTIADEKTKKNS